MNVPMNIEFVNGSDVVLTIVKSMRSSTYIDSLDTLLLCQKHLSEQCPLFQDPTLDRSLVDGEDEFNNTSLRGYRRRRQVCRAGVRYQDYFTPQLG
jgi:hypothetical protein